MAKIDMDELNQLLLAYRDKVIVSYAACDNNEVSDQEYVRLYDTEQDTLDAILNYVGKANV